MKIFIEIDPEVFANYTEEEFIDEVWNSVAEDVIFGNEGLPVSRDKRDFVVACVFNDNKEQIGQIVFEEDLPPLIQKDFKL